MPLPPPAMLRRSAWVFIAMAAACGPLASCATSPPIAEAFVRDRTGQAARAYQNAVDAQAYAAESIATAMGLLADDALAGINPSTAYDSARRQLIRAQSRIDAAARSAGTANARGQDLIDNWAGELRRYTDDGLRRDAEARLDLARATRTTMNDALDRTQRALPEALRELQDRTLFLKHCRDQGTLRPAPVSTEGLQRYAKARADLAEAVALARAALADWRAVLGQTTGP